MSPVWHAGRHSSPSGCPIAVLNSFITRGRTMGTGTTGSSADQPHDRDRSTMAAMDHRIDDRSENRKAVEGRHLDREIGIFGIDQAIERK